MNAPLPPSVWEQVFELTNILVNPIGPGDWLTIDASSCPEPLLSLLSSQVHKLLSLSRVIERYWSHATTWTGSRNLVSTELGSTGSPWDPVVFAPWLIVGGWGTASWLRGLTALLRCLLGSTPVVVKIYYFKSRQTFIGYSRQLKVGLGKPSKKCYR